MNKVKVGSFEIGGGEPLALMAGPCVLESLDRCLYIGRTIKDRSPFCTTVVTCLTNGSEGYIPSTKSHADGGYESLSSKFAAPTGDRLVDAQLNQLSALKGNAGGAKPDQKPEAGK